jgi:hypothetical protein
MACPTPAAAWPPIVSRLDPSGASWSDAEHPAHPARWSTDAMSSETAAGSSGGSGGRRDPTARPSPTGRSAPSSSSRGTITALDPQARTLTIRLDGTGDRTVTLPRSYLDGRGRGERNRRVDLAYATTGHRAQGLTRGRALVRLTGTEDVNWLYVQLSRARQETCLYAVVGPEPHGAGELDLPDREQPDGYLQLAQALSRAGGQTLAIDTPSSPDLQRLSMAELRAERDQLCRQLDQAPRDRSRELARATVHRQQAEATLAAHQQPTDRQPTGMLRFLHRGGDQPASIPGGLAVVTQQVNRAHDRERELRQHQQHRQGWLEANAHLGSQYRQIVRALAWQRRATGVAVEADRPGYVLETLAQGFHESWRAVP